jgi:medium-chain acyl-[acyl-carrier-protein] hydrolase
VEAKEEKFRIRTYECGVDGRIKIFSLMQYMQEIASLHAEQLGLGFDRLSEMNGYWVLSNIRIEISRLPGRDDEVTLKTWPSGYSRTIATREFVGKDQNGSELFRAGSEWMVINKQTNRLKNLFRLNLNLPKTGVKSLPDELKRLEPKNEYNQVGKVLVPHSAIDLNGHVNNTEYVRWGIDALRRTFKLNNNIRCMQATYLSEVFEDDELDMLVSVAGILPACRRRYSDEGISSTSLRQAQPAIRGRDALDTFGVLGRKSGTEANVFLMEVSCFIAELAPFDSAQGEG